MEGIKFTEVDYEALLKIHKNKYLRRPPEKKYADFSRIDPFPSISDALLNSIDIVKYVLTVGMIYPFFPENLDGATYTCNFSGKYKYWDDKGKPRIEEKDVDEFRLRPNSIAFLEIEPTFRIPEYLILRFNLKVHHVYKGLLLGTGPIVDPGFQGKLYIPLHNLTSNEYLIQKGAPLISIEFTKLSTYEKRNILKYNKLKRISDSLDFSLLPFVYKNFEPRDIDEYIYKALFGDSKFIKSKDNVNSNSLSVGSSIPKSIKKAKKRAIKAEESGEKSRKYIRQIRNIGIIAIMGIAIAGLAIINDVNGRVDNILIQYANFTIEYERLEKTNITLQDKISVMQKVIDDLQFQINDLQKENEKSKAMINEPVGGVQ